MCSRPGLLHDPDRGLRFLNLLWKSLLEPRNVTQRSERLITINTLLLGVLLALTVLQEVFLQISDQLGCTDTADYRLRVRRSMDFWTVFGTAWSVLCRA